MTSTFECDVLDSTSTTLDSINVDTITEKTTNNGVTIEGIQLIDSHIDAPDFVRANVLIGDVLFGKAGVIVETQEFRPIATNTHDLGASTRRWVSTYTNSIKAIVGTVTQATSITTGVALNSSYGRITTVSSTLASNNTATFTVTNSSVLASTDLIMLTLNGYSGTNGVPSVRIGTISAGSFTIVIRNAGTVALNGTLDIGFLVINNA